MKTLHWYLTRQVLATLVLTVVVFVFVLLVGNALKEILALLVNRQATLGVVAKAIALLIPFVLSFALPMGMLTAVLLVFGRFSADNELAAVKAGGVSLLSLSSPILMLSIALSVLCAIFNLYFSQTCRVSYKSLIYEQAARQPAQLLTEGRFINDFRGCLIYVGRVRGNQLEDVIYSELTNNQVVFNVRAAKGEYTYDATNKLFKVTLFGGVQGMQYTADNDSWIPSVVEEFTQDIPAENLAASQNKPKYSEMTFSQLWTEKRELEALHYLQTPNRKMTPDQLKAEKEIVEQMRQDTIMPVLIHLHHQASFSFACVGFTLIGIPLGIRSHRRETSIGIAIALILVMIYYSFFVAGQALQGRPELAPHLILWLPNFIFQAAGGVLLWRANR
jgi:lipopolysaccharide export system permease protein